jgi:branched-chain amino acid transport system ATP-binding protein
MPPESGTLLELTAVSAGYGRTVIIEDIGLVLHAGRSVALVGRNGAGKTTLLSTIIGRTRLHRGDIRLKGSSLAAAPPYRRVAAGVGFVPQTREIFRSLTVAEHLAVAERPGAWTATRLYDLLPRLAERRRHLGMQLSGGEQQMLAIARALIANPSVLLLDEPFEGLAPIIIDQLLAVLRRIRDEERLTILLVEQKAALALEFADEAVALASGRIAWQGQSRALLADRGQLTALLGATGGATAPRRAEAVS